MRGFGFVKHMVIHPYYLQIMETLKTLEPIVSYLLFNFTGLETFFKAILLEL